MITDLLLRQFRFHLGPQGALQMPAHNKDNVIRGWFGSREKGGVAGEVAA